MRKKANENETSEGNVRNKPECPMWNTPKRAHGNLITIVFTSTPYIGAQLSRKAKRTEMKIEFRDLV